MCESIKLEYKLCFYINYLLNVLAAFLQIIKLCASVCVSVSQSVSHSPETSWTLYRSQSSTDLYQTCHQGRVPGDVVTYCFWWKSEISMSVKPEVELIFSMTPMKKMTKLIITPVLCIVASKFLLLVWDYRGQEFPLCYSNFKGRLPWQRNFGIA